MPGALFDQSVSARTRNTRPLGTISFSVLLHAAALVVLLVFHVTASTIPRVDDPTVPVFVAPKPVVPVAPPVQRVPRSEVAHPQATVPLEAPSTITKEPQTPPTYGPPPPPGLMVGQSGTLAGFSDSGQRSNITLTAPPPKPPAVVHVGGEIKPPARVFSVAPEYPSIARTARVEGEVTLEATIDETGVVRNVIVTKSVPLLDRAAIEAVSKWKYSPTLLNGRPVSVIMTVSVRFTLR